MLLRRDVKPRPPLPLPPTNPAPLEHLRQLRARSDVLSNEALHRHQFLARGVQPCPQHCQPLA